MLLFKLPAAREVRDHLGGRAGAALPGIFLWSAVVLEAKADDFPERVGLIGCLPKLRMHLSKQASLKA